MRDGRWRARLLPEDQPLPLASGWNLAAYLPRQPLTVTEALQGIAGNYGAVLGFEDTALSYYPDLDPSYNTLRWMAPGYGYWISATQAITLQYPVTGITRTLPMTTTRRAMERLRPALKAEWDAGVQPTYEWMNFYGKPALPDGTAVPTGTVVLAVDPQGVICGATTTWEVGQYGLLACYRDDPYTPERRRRDARRHHPAGDLVGWDAPRRPGHRHGDVDGSRRPPAGTGRGAARAVAQDLSAATAEGRSNARRRSGAPAGARFRFIRTRSSDKQMAKDTTASWSCKGCVG